MTNVVFPIFLTWTEPVLACLSRILAWALPSVEGASLGDCLDHLEIRVELPTLFDQIFHIVELVFFFLLHESHQQFYR